MRKTQVGTGDRSAKIRTYNFPQSRVTDHRIGFTTHDLAGVMDGDLEPIIEALQARRRRGAAGWLTRRRRERGAWARAPSARCVSEMAALLARDVRRRRAPRGARAARRAARHAALTGRPSSRRTRSADDALGARAARRGASARAGAPLAVRGGPRRLPPSHARRRRARADPAARDRAARGSRARTRLRERAGRDRGRRRHRLGRDRARAGERGPLRAGDRHRRLARRARRRARQRRAMLRRVLRAPVELRARLAARRRCTSAGCAPWSRTRRTLRCDEARGAARERARLGAVRGAVQRRRRAWRRPRGWCARPARRSSRAGCSRWRWTRGARRLGRGARGDATARYEQRAGGAGPHRPRALRGRQTTGGADMIERQGEGPRPTDRTEPRVPGGEARERRAQPGRGGRRAPAADGAAPHRRAADDPARRAADRGDGAAARRAARPGAGPAGVPAARRRAGELRQARWRA